MTELFGVLEQSFYNPFQSPDCFFLTGDTNYIEPRNLYRKYQSYLTECGLPHYTFHCLRHTFATRAIECGIEIVKFFPANVYGGLKALKALAGPFPQLKFIPTGGVDLTNLKEFLEFDKIYAVGGSFMMKGDIVENCKKICEIVNG